MQTRNAMIRGWDEGEDFEFGSSADGRHGSSDHDYFDDDAECVATVEDGFERGAALSGLWIHVQSLRFRTGRVTAVCSGVTIDLREVAFDTDGATIHIQAALSGITILVPELCEVVWNVDAIFGALSEPRERWRVRDQRPRERMAGERMAAEGTAGARRREERTPGEGTAERPRARLRIVGTIVAGGLSVR